MEGKVKDLRPCWYLAAKRPDLQRDGRRHDRCGATTLRQSASEDSTTAARWTPAALNVENANVEIGEGGTAYPEGSWIPGYFFTLPEASDDEARQAR